MPSLPCPSALQHANLYEWKLLQVPVSHSPPRLAPLAAHCNVGTRGDRRVPGIRSLYSSHAAASARAHLSRPSPPDATASPPPRSRDKFRYRQGRQEGCKQRLSSRNTHSEAETRGAPRRLARPRTHPWRLLSWARARWMPAGLLWITWSRRKTAELLGGGGGRGRPGVRSSGRRLKRTEHQLQRS